MFTKVCSNCDGADKCSKYCAMQAGIALVNFIRGVDTVDTDIGDLREDGIDNKELNLIVSGYIVDAYSYPTHILSNFNSCIDISGKFKSYLGLSPQQILKVYVDTLDVSDEAKSEAYKAFKLFNSNKKLPLAIKPGSECMIYSGSDNKEIPGNYRVSSIRWKTDKLTGKLGCEVCCVLEKGVLESNCKYTYINITEYGERLRLPNIERTLKSSETDRDLIKMSSIGLIKPIVIEDEAYKLALDGQQLYRITEEATFIIAKWKNDRLVSFSGGLDAVEKSKAFSKIKEGIRYIDRHRRFIVPYGLYDINYIHIN